jgi:PAS domain S-box-containing protein
MKPRITLIIPLVLAISTLASSVLLFVQATYHQETRIRSEALERIKLDITRLQNVLYNQLTGSTDALGNARLNVSVTAMDRNIVNLLLTDSNDMVLVANRYSHERQSAQAISGYAPSIAAKVRNENSSSVFFSGENESLLVGYYPVVLQLEDNQIESVKRMGVLYVESSIATQLDAAFAQAVNQVAMLAGAILLMSMMVAVLLHNVISRRLIRLARAARELATGNLDARAGLQGRDELADLGHVFDDMALRIKADISRREFAENELIKLNESLERRVRERTELLEQAQRIGRIGNWHLDVASGNLTWSDEIYRIFGYAPGAIQPSYEQFFRMVHPADVMRVKESEQQAFAEGARHSIDHRVLLANGDVRWVHEEAVVARDEFGRAESLSGTIQDITERKQHEQQLLLAKEDAERASRAKSDFLSRMSHELRTPMNAILGFAQVLDRELTAVNTRSYVHEITQAGDHLLALIDELLDLGRIEAGRMVVALNTVDVSMVVAQALKIVDTMLARKHLIMDNQCQTPRLIIADASRLRQVLVNLLSNAAKYNRVGGKISVSCTARDNEILRISVTDSGAGIAAENIGRLFTPFERLGAENSGVDGTGIGLALSKQLVELMGGDMGVESTSGKGSTFWIEFPLADQKTLEDVSMSSNQTHTGKLKCKVLYVEDNAANLRLVEAMLKHHQDITLMAAKNGRFGLELAQQYNPDVILLDIQLPDMDGFKVLKELQAGEDTRQIPVIAVSADAMPMDVERGLASGFREYLTKPVKIENLVRAIREHTRC